MSVTENPEINFGLAKRTPVIRQTESAECGLACLAMILGHYGNHCDMFGLRKKFPLSLQGATVGDLIRISGDLGLNSRALTLDLCDFDSLRLPCVLHWNFKHFVVLTRITKKGIEMIDPAYGRRKVTMAEVDRSFTGVALEFWPNNDFTLAEPGPKLSLRRLIGTVRGIVPAAGQILFLALLIEVGNLGSPLLMQWIMDSVLIGQDYTLLVALAAGSGILMLLQNVVTALRGWALVYFNANVSLQWRSNIFSHLLRLPISYFERRALGDVISRFSSVDQIQRVVSTSFIEAFIDGTFGLITFVIMLLYSPMLAAISAAAVLLYVVMRLFLFSYLEQSTHDFIVAASKQDGHLIESLRGIRALKLFQREANRRAQWIKYFTDQVNADVKVQQITLGFRLVNGLLFGTEVLVVTVVGALMVMDLRFTAGALIAFLGFRGQFSGRMLGLTEKMFDLKLLSLQCERLADIALTEKESVPTEEALLPTPQHASTIELRNVTFQYAKNTFAVLRNLNLTIAPGESIAITGASGCGKSTLLQLICGVYPPTYGSVNIDGIDVRKLGHGFLRENISVVMQDDQLFSGTIIDNICFFDENPDYEWAKECARLAQISTDIEAMPMAYNTLVGDMGSVLSGGQKQRVIIARALYKKPRILILDEATSHLDVENEKRVNKAISDMNITRIIVAHRHETILSADRIVTLADGAILHDTWPHVQAESLEPDLQN